MGASQRRTATRMRSVGGWSRGQSSVIGVVLLFGLVIAGTGIVVALGTTALTDSQERSNTDRATQELTLFDSRAAMVALGDAERQTVQLSGTSGTHNVKNDTGRMIVTVTNRTNSKTDEVYNASLGALEYTNGKTTLAYQGGGVWRTDGQNSTTMVSPPEFHYRKATLTLPVIQVTNTDSAGGSISAEISPDGTTKRVFPNGSAAFDKTTDGTSDTVRYWNPIKRQNWTVAVTVKSEYARGWYQYFNERTEGDSAYYPGNDTATVQLSSIRGSIGEFDMPPEGDALDVGGMAGGHPVSEYQISLKQGRNGWSNGHWGFYVDKPQEKFELHIHTKPGTQCKKGSLDPNEIDISVFYRNTSGPTTIHEEWQNQTVTAPDLQADCSDERMNIDLVSATSNLTYGDITLTAKKSKNAKWEFAPTIKDNNITSDTTSFNAHAPDTGNYADGSSEKMDFVLNHYFGMLAPEYDLQVTDGPGSSSNVDETASGGVLSYDESLSGEYLTYLHVTENRIEIDVD